MFVSALIAAAGRGSRVGGGTPKQFLELAGKTMLERSVEALAASPLVSEIVVAVPPDRVASELPSSPSGRVPIRLIPGGEHRQESVANALRAADPRAELLLIHDAARPFVAVNLIAQTIEAARRTGAAIAAIRVTDTVKHVEAAEPGRPLLIRQTLPRDELWLAQTPQVFRRELLGRALAQRSPSHPATDEASLVEAIGHNVEIVEGDAGNVKITSPADLQAAEARFAASPGRLRVGVGYDLHRLVPGRALVLAGVTIPFGRGLDGHSDADIVCHAITDAVLGAAALGDIGRFFPDTDPQWKGADSLALLAVAVARATAQGFGIENVDATVIAQAPKLLPHLEAMRHNLAGALGCDASVVSVKGKTNEGVDSMGRGESMACHAVVLLTARGS